MIVFRLQTFNMDEQKLLLITEPIFCNNPKACRKILFFCFFKGTSVMLTSGFAYKMTPCSSSVVISLVINRTTTEWCLNVKKLSEQRFVGGCQGITMCFQGCSRLL